MYARKLRDDQIVPSPLGTYRPLSAIGGVGRRLDFSSYATAATSDMDSSWHSTKLSHRRLGSRQFQRKQTSGRLQTRGCWCRLNNEGRRLRRGWGFGSFQAWAQKPVLPTPQLFLFPFQVYETNCDVRVPFGVNAWKLAESSLFQLCGIIEVIFQVPSVQLEREVLPLIILAPRFMQPP